MKVDAPFPQPPVTAPAPRPVSDQASARPVDRPHHDEATDNRRPRNYSLQALAGDQDAKPTRDADERQSASGHDDVPASREQQPVQRNATEPAQVGNLLDVLA